MQRVFKVDPSIWGVRFLSNNQVGWSTGLLLALDPFCPEDHPLEDPEVVDGQPPRPGGVRPDFPHKSCPMGVRVDVALLLPPPVLQESFGLLSEDVGLLKLQVGEVRPNVFSARVVPMPVVLLLWLGLLIKSMAVGATEPGVKVGSSSGFFIPGPFQGFPG